MRHSFHEQIDELQRELLKMGVLVAELIGQAVAALAKQNLTSARAVIAADDTVDKMLVDIEQRSLQLLALQQPMAGDLRRIGTVLKIVTDLERMADHATDIAKITLRLDGQPLLKELVDIPRMADLVQYMTREALEAYVRRDVARAKAMAAMDDEIDHIYRRVFDEIVGIMQRAPEHVQQAVYLLQTAMYLERVGDHATNLGEWTVYMVTGELPDMN